MKFIKVSKILITLYQTIHFTFTPQNDVGFFIQLIYDIPIQIGKKNKYQIKNASYFDIFDEYIEFSLSL